MQPSEPKDTKKLPWSFHQTNEEETKYTDIVKKVERTFNMINLDEDFSDNNDSVSVKSVSGYATEPSDA